MKKITKAKLGVISCLINRHENVNWKIFEIERDSNNPYLCDTPTNNQNTIDISMNAAISYHLENRIIDHDFIENILILLDSQNEVAVTLKKSPACDLGIAIVFFKDIQEIKVELLNFDDWKKRASEIKANCYLTRKNKVY